MSGKYATETLRANQAGIDRAGEILRGGGLVAVPTETVYGLAARADSAAAVYVLTSDDIRRSGYTSIPEVLRLVPAFRYMAWSSESDYLFGG